jgi:hypothetical protein
LSKSATRRTSGEGRVGVDLLLLAEKDDLVEVAAIETLETQWDGLTTTHRQINEAGSRRTIRMGENDMGAFCYSKIILHLVKPLYHVI